MIPPEHGDRWQAKREDQIFNMTCNNGRVLCPFSYFRLVVKHYANLVVFTDGEEISRRLVLHGRLDGRCSSSNRTWSEMFPIHP